MRILVDADACPVKNEITRIARQHQLDLIFFADVNHKISTDYGHVITADQGADSVDLKLINAMKKGDLVVSQDYGVASLAIGKGGYVLHPSGKELNAANIDLHMFERHLGQKARRRGKYGSGPKKRTEKDNIYFAQQLQAMISRG